MQHWLCRTQTWSPDALHRLQFDRLASLLRHAHAFVPFYHRRLRQLGIDLGAALTRRSWDQVPLLTRRDIQAAGSELHATRLPPSHGRTFTTFTGGSTGQPVLTVGTQLTAFGWQAFALRDHFWHQRDSTLKLASIRHSSNERARPPLGHRARDWGPAISPYLRTGPGVLLTTDSTTEQQAQWLLSNDPDYLLGYPSCILALARHFRESGLSLERIREVRTFGEIVEPEVRTACREAWGVPLTDLYSSQELGYIALQCPTTDHYHVQEENVLLEVLDESGQACPPGTIGRVVVTSLHNFAMPLIRYDLGDFAEVGEPCSCGRHLLVLRRVLGRQRNMLVLPGGQQVWPALQPGKDPAVARELASIRQMQVIQKSLEQIEVRLVSRSRLDPASEERLRTFIEESLPCPFKIEFCYVDAIARSPSGKFEDFRSEVRAGRSQ